MFPEHAIARILREREKKGKGRSAEVAWRPTQRLRDCRGEASLVTVPSVLRSVKNFPRVRKVYENGSGHDVCTVQSFSEKADTRLQLGLPHIESERAVLPNANCAGRRARAAGHRLTETRCQPKNNKKAFTSRGFVATTNVYPFPFKRSICHFRLTQQLLKRSSDVPRKSEPAPKGPRHHVTTDVGSGGRQERRGGGDSSFEQFHPPVSTVPRDTKMDGSHAQEMKETCRHTPLPFRLIFYTPRFRFPARCSGAFGEPRHSRLLDSGVIRREMIALCKKEAHV